MPGERAQRRIHTLLDEADPAISRNDWATAAERARPDGRVALMTIGDRAATRTWEVYE